ncbi:hypothetical protein DIPPA_25804 [Diplonema papillatum]|nr:hypothetical protein DIPPA_19024 [Diplonema papillatum]KAJ9466479.1 hypothetical protein DIPPA_25804 [Diplonema papillatum]
MLVTTTLATLLSIGQVLVETGYVVCSTGESGPLWAEEGIVRWAVSIFIIVTLVSKAEKMSGSCAVMQLVFLYGIFTGALNLLIVIVATAQSGVPPDYFSCQSGLTGILFAFVTAGYIKAKWCVLPLIAMMCFLPPYESTPDGGIDNYYTLKYVPLHVAGWIMGIFVSEQPEWCDLGICTFLDYWIKRQLPDSMWVQKIGEYNDPESVPLI